MASGQITGKDAYVSLEVSNVEKDLSGDGNSATLEITAEAPEKTTYGAGTRQRAGGIKDWTLRVSGIYNDTTDSIDDVLSSLLGIQTVMVFGPAGNTTGYRKYSGSGIVTSYSVEAPVDGMVTASFEVVASSGSLTKGTF